MRLFSFRCDAGHVFDEFVKEPTPRKCKCGAFAQRIFTAPRVIIHEYEARMSETLREVVRSPKDFRERLKIKSDKDEREYEIVDDPKAWAEFSRIDGIEVEKDKLVYHGGQKKLDVAFEEPDEGETNERLKPSSVLAKELHEHYR